MRVLIIDGGLSDVAGLSAALRSEGFSVLGPVSGTAELYRHAEALKPDAIVIAADAPERDCLEDVALSARHSPQPMILLAGQAEADMMRRAIEAGVSFYVVPEMSSTLVHSLVQTAVAHHQQARELERALARAQQKLDEQRTVADAKCRLMEQEGISESEAYHRLRKAAMAQGRRLPDVAQTLLNTASG